MADDDVIQAANEAKVYYENMTGKKIPGDLLRDVKNTYEKQGVVRSGDGELDKEQMMEVLATASGEKKLFGNRSPAAMNRKTKASNAIGKIKQRQRVAEQKKKTPIWQPRKTPESQPIKVPKLRKPEKQKKEPEKQKREFKPYEERRTVIPFILRKRQQPKQYNTETGEEVPAGKPTYEVTEGAKMAGGVAVKAGGYAKKTKVAKAVIWPFRKAAGVPAFIKGPTPIPRGMNPATAKYDSEKRAWSGEKIEPPEKPEHLKYGWKKPKGRLWRDRIGGAVTGMAKGSPPNRVVTKETRTGILNWFGRRKEGIGYRLENRKYNKAETQREAINMRTKMDYWKGKISPVSNVSKILPQVGFSLPGPFQVFTLAWQKMTSTMKLVIVMVFFLAILFLPWGIFYYAGWAIGAAAMFLVSMIYWIFVNFFNAIATGIIGVVNGVATIFMGFIIWIVEAIMGVFMNGYHWVNGRDLLTNSLITYNTVADVPSLLTVKVPEWQNWFNTTLIAKLLEHVPGLQAFVNAYNDVVVKAIKNVFSGFVESAPGWQVILIGLIPIFIIAAIVIIVYVRNRKYFY
jgi:hypothetical protein